MSETPKLYAERDHIALGEHYTRHVSAMTGEGLHAKSAIAAELAWRDQQLAAALRERDEARANYQFMVDRAADAKLDGYRELGERAAKAENERDALRAQVERLRAVVSNDRIALHSIKASECPPDSMVILASSLRRLAALAATEKQT